MPQVIVSPTALRDLERLREFLRPKNPTAAQRAATAIIQTIRHLSTHPEIGRSVEEPNQRELLIEFGSSGFVARYYFVSERVIILAIRHQKEAGFDPQETNISNWIEAVSDTDISE